MAIEKTRESWRLWVAVLVLAVGGFFLFRVFLDVGYGTSESLNVVWAAKFWSILAVLVASIWIYLRRDASSAPLWTVFAVSAYFVILYGMLFFPTEYGMNGHWGDNGNRLAAICKMMAFNTINVDWYLKDLPSFYPPGWFALMAIYAKVIGIEAYQTVKWGYLLIFLVYPWALYGMWRKLVDSWSAALAVVFLLFFAYKYMDWIYYENITAGLFLPWWLYYFEEGTSRAGSLKANWKYYLAGIVIGTALFCTYYYWFLFAILSVPFTFIVRYKETRSRQEMRHWIVNKLVLGLGIFLLSSPYWAPLARSIYWKGSESAQHQWFGLHHADLTMAWSGFSMEILLIFGGVFFSFFLWSRWSRGRIPLLFLGAVLVILLDRLYNFSGSSLQSRKVIEMAHVFVLAPLGIGLAQEWSKVEKQTSIRYALLGVALFAALVVSNEHTQVYSTNFYKIAVNQRVPEKDLEVFESVDYRGKVFLTNNYREACYLPYYLFIPYNNMTSHTAGRYSQRELFIEKAALISEPVLLAYVFANARYSPIDYVYLPLNDEKQRLEQTLYQCSFNYTGGNVKKILYKADVLNAPDFFIERHDRLMYEIAAPDRCKELDDSVKTAYPDIYWHLEPKEF